MPGTFRELQLIAAVRFGREDEVTRLLKPGLKLHKPVVGSFYNPHEFSIIEFVQHIMYLKKRSNCLTDSDRRIFINLLRHGGGVDQFIFDGTPLWHAVSMGDLPLVQMLVIDCRANIFLKDRVQKTSALGEAGIVAQQFYAEYGDDHPLARNADGIEAVLRVYSVSVPSDIRSWGFVGPKESPRPFCDVQVQAMTEHGIRRLTVLGC